VFIGAVANNNNNTNNTITITTSVDILLIVRQRDTHMVHSLGRYRTEIKKTAEFTLNKGDSTCFFHFGRIASRPFNPCGVLSENVRWIFDLLKNLTQ